MEDALNPAPGVAPAHRGMIVRQAEPLNLEMPFGALDELVTPTEEFFVRCHFAIPTIGRERWRLRIGGGVQHPYELTWEELRQFTPTTLTATIECAGNGRVFLSPTVEGAQWERGAVGNAAWTGVWLKQVLERAQPRPDAREVILTGADQGEIESPPRPGRTIHYARSLPIDKAGDDVLLAWQMNGEDLTPAHGFPLRALVPGWYGMASVKWLTDITVTAEPFHGYYQSIDYAYWRRDVGEPSLVAITEMQVKAQVARPGPGEAVPAGQPYLVRGAAWSGNTEVVRVEVSVDGGCTWQEARLGEAVDRRAWRFWEFEWQVPAAPGRVTLVVRATDAEGRTQPERRDPDRGSYMVNEVLGMDVQVH
jgi:DMSO/TMAO reductase YedYZ molybdopterin-dependent catalytic subunit